MRNESRFLDSSFPSRVVSVRCKLLLFCWWRQMRQEDTRLERTLPLLSRSSSSVLPNLDRNAPRAHFMRMTSTSVQETHCTSSALQMHYGRTTNAPGALRKHINKAKQGRKAEWQMEIRSLPYSGIYKLFRFSCFLKGQKSIWMMVSTQIDNFYQKWIF